MTREQIDAELAVIEQKKPDLVALCQQIGEAVNATNRRERQLQAAKAAIEAGEPEPDSGVALTALWEEVDGLLVEKLGTGEKVVEPI